MADQLPTVQTDNGPKESIPVTPFDPLGNYSGNVNLIPLGYQQVTLSASTVLVVSDLMPGAVQSNLKMETFGARYRDDGVDPTPAIGYPLDVGESLTYDVHMTGRDFRIIGQQNGAVVNILFYGATETEAT